MRAVFCLLLLLPLTGCAAIDDWTDWMAFSESQPASPCASRPVPVRACGDGGIIQAGLPAQTAEPPRGAGR